MINSHKKEEKPADFLFFYDEAPVNLMFHFYSPYSPYSPSMDLSVINRYSYHKNAPEITSKSQEFIFFQQQKTNKTKVTEKKSEMIP